jgi:hypothetical protein
MNDRRSEVGKIIREQLKAESSKRERKNNKQPTTHNKPHAK